ncbi:MAG: ATP/GTP-binding protein [Candidatus Thermoplasmatota archaeon]|nr:ATP/GTP-binding protein [Candidatus Thermoplasmatota archaeon]
MAVNLYFVGTAGSGKTTLTKAFKDWMDQQGYQAVTVNLDPGADNLPYAVDIDVRDWVSLSEVMREQELGPNGAQIVSADMVAMKSQEIRKVMDEYECHYFLIDTPGQMELFTFREASREMVRTLGERSLINFLFDPVLSKQPSGFVSLMSLAATTQFRFDIPYFPVLSKSDLLSEEEMEKITSWSKDFWRLDTALREKASPETQVSIELIKSIQNMGLQRGITPVSSVDQQGLEEIYTAVQDAFFGGDDLMTD